MVSWRILDYFVVAGYLVLTAGAPAGPVWLVSHALLCNFRRALAASDRSITFILLWWTDLSYLGSNLPCTFARAV